MLASESDTANPIRFSPKSTPRMGPRVDMMSTLARAGSSCSLEASPIPIRPIEPDGGASLRPQRVFASHIANRGVRESGISAV